MHGIYHALLDHTTIDRYHLIGTFLESDDSAADLGGSGDKDQQLVDIITALGKTRTSVSLAAMTFTVLGVHI